MDRKIDHINLVLEKRASTARSHGLDCYEFDHYPLTELNLETISLKTNFLNFSFDLPLMISSMTGGGGKKTQQLNEQLARLALEFNLPLGLGSMRSIFENLENKLESFSIARSVSSKLILFANLGAQQLVNKPLDDIYRLVDCIKANGLIIHLNPLQELIQPEGDKSFEGILSSLDELKKLKLPVILKETGCGFGRRSLNMIKERFPEFTIDLAGHGGTHFGKVETHRIHDPTHFELFSRFNNWGISTSKSLLWAREILPSSQSIIASGGLETGHDVIKCLCLGANFTAMAAPILRAVHKGNQHKFLKDLCLEMKMILLLIGAKNISSLKKEMLIKV